MIEQMDGSYDNPFKFNAKELDDDTGLYYYGARYYNPRLSIWYGVDPLAVYNPVMESEFYGDGQHNGGVFFWGNNNPYIYTYQNPIKYIDPNGKQTLSWALAEGFSSTAAAGGSAGGGAFLGPAIIVVGGMYYFSKSQKELSQRYWTNRNRQEDALRQHTTLKEQKEAYLRESFPIAEKDNLSVETIPKGEEQGIIILNSNKAKFGNAKQRDINKRLGEINAGNADGHPYLNDGRDGSQILPKKGKTGDIDYTTYDLNKPPTQEQRKNGATRDKTRIVTGSDGSAYITNQHYKEKVDKKETPTLPNFKNEDYFKDKKLSVDLMFEFWSEKLEEMLFPFQYYNSPDSFEHLERDIVKEKIKKGLEMFAKYFDDLWI